MEIREHQIKVDILKRTRNITSLCVNAESSGINTLGTLADQGEQLSKINQQLSSIDVTLDDTRENISRMKGLTARLFNTVRTHFDRMAHVKLFSKMPHTSSKSKQVLVGPLRSVSQGEFVFFCCSKENFYLAIFFRDDQLLN
jgi:hypothetical protein